MVGGVDMEVEPSQGKTAPKWIARQPMQLAGLPNPSLLQRLQEGF